MTLVSDKTDFKRKTVTIDKWHCIMIKGSIQEEDITLLNTYAPNVEAPKYIKQLLMNTKGEIDSTTITVADFNIPLTAMDRSTRQKINKETVAFNDT